jgi:hypothetical protein
MTLAKAAKGLDIAPNTAVNREKDLKGEDCGCQAIKMEECWRNIGGPREAS